MSQRYYANAPATTLTSSCSDAATSIIVASTSGLPIQYPYTLILDKGLITEEAVSVTAAAGTTLTVTRGYDSTPAFAHVIGASVEHGITAADIREANNHVNADSGVHGLTGSVVGTTDAQHLTNKTAATPATTDDSEAVATTEFVRALLLEMHPVGDLVFNTSGTNPGSYLGGTWVAWGSGRVPVGVDAGQAEFNTVEETGGAKTHTLTTSEMPNHSHGGATGLVSNDHTHSGTTGGQTADHTHTVPTIGHNETGVHDWSYADGSGRTFNIGIALSTYGSSGDHAHNFTTGGISANHNHTITAEGGGAAHNNLQPYITCYIFKRTA